MTRSESPPPAPRFEIIDERHAPRRLKRRSPWGIGALLGAVRGVIEDGYVSLARGVMARGEDLEDARAARSHASRTRKAERRRRRQARHGAPAHDAARHVPPAAAS